MSPWSNMETVKYCIGHFVHVIDHDHGHDDDDRVVSRHTSLPSAQDERLKLNGSLPWNVTSEVWDPPKRPCTS